MAERQQAAGPPLPATLLHCIKYALWPVPLANSTAPHTLTPALAAFQAGLSGQRAPTSCDPPCHTESALRPRCPTASDPTLRLPRPPPPAFSAALPPHLQLAKQVRQIGKARLHAPLLAVNNHPPTNAAPLRQVPQLPRGGSGGGAGLLERVGEVAVLPENEGAAGPRASQGSSTSAL